MNLKKLWLRLLKAESKHKSKKAGKLEYKIIQEELNERRNMRTENDFQKESS
jgi:hypothetical protein